jgi:histidinol-phosphate phosphatase family protein
VTGANRASIVIPSIGRPSLTALLGSLAASATASGLPLPAIRVVDDRPGGRPLSDLLLSGSTLPAGSEFHVLRSGGRGPAAARNVGWRACDTPWIAFLDDDVTVSASWLADLDADLSTARADVGGSQGRIIVPRPDDRALTDWERGTAGLESARWITADMAYRASALVAAGGFDERFRRAFREDADLALAVQDCGYRLMSGRRVTVHPVRPGRWWDSVRQQHGNADDVLMYRLHGRDWRQRAGARLGRRPGHLITTTLGVGAVVAALAGHRRLARWSIAGWAGSAAEFSWRRIAPGPRDRTEIARMISTSLVIAPVAVGQWARGHIRHRKVKVRAADRGRSLPAAVLLDRDGTIVHDVPYNGDPALVELMPGAREALDRLRQAGIPLGIITNQSGVGRGWLDRRDVDAVNARIENLLGPFAVWAVCPHVEEDACGCRKPQPGLIYRAAAELSVDPRDCVVIGDIEADLGAARAASARAILVPTSETRAEEIANAPVWARDLGHAVDLVLSGRAG